MANQANEDLAHEVSIKEMRNRPISQPPKKPGGQGCLFLLGLAFAIFGLAFIYIGFVRPVMQSYEAQDWTAVECKIIDSKIEAHTDDDGTSYSAEFEYEYQVDGNTLTGDRHNFLDVAGTHGEAKQFILKYPIGSQQTCYYNPSDPSQVVLDRDNENLSYLFLILPAIFILVGFGMASAAIFSWLKRYQTISGAADADELPNRFSTVSKPLVDRPVGVLAAGLTEQDNLDQEWLPPRKLESNTYRLTTFLVILGICLFWNGIVWFGFSSMFEDFGNGFGWFSLFPLLFMVPFIGVGGLLLLGSGYLFLSLFNPYVNVAISAGAVPLGGEVDIAWEIDGKAERIRRLRIEIHGIQSVTFVRGTNQVTETSVFKLIPVADETDITGISFGSATVQIPPDVMHTFESTNNRIQWTVQVYGDIPYAPDIAENFSFRVTPVANTLPSTIKTKTSP